jgi:peptidoglycan LD-endopeptidase LytH
VVASVSGVLEHQPSPLGGNAFKLHGDDGVDYYGAHLDRLLVAPGRVKMGQQIGTVGDTGNAKGTPTHLHFERRPGGGAHTNPMPYLLAGCPQA